MTTVTEIAEALGISAANSPGKHIIGRVPNEEVIRISGKLLVGEFS